MTVEARPATTRQDPGRVLWTVTGVGWLAMLALMWFSAGTWAMPAMTASAVGGTEGPQGLALIGVLIIFLIGWILMVTSMMLPTTVPMARMFGLVTVDVPARRRVIAAFYVAYLAVWVGAGVLGLAGASLVARVTAAAPSGIVLGVALAAAGAFQFSSLKSRCLTKCRDPRSLIFTRYRRGVGAAWSLGSRHALSCLGCCWALMAVMFAVGSGAMVWMLGLTAVMVAEKTAPWGRLLVKPLGVVLLLAAAVIVVSALFGVSSGELLPLPMSEHHHR